MCQLFAGIAAFAGWSADESLAQNYPVKPIHLAVGFPAGSGADFVARIAAKKLSEHLGQNVVVENRTGAGGTIATERVALSPADGYTLLMMTAAETAQPALRANLRYSLERDLAPVSLLPSLPTVDESGLPGYERSTWHGVLTPAGVPKDIIARLNAVIVKSVNTPEVKRSFDSQGLELQTNTAEEFAALIRNSVARNTRLIKTTGAKAE